MSDGKIRKPDGTLVFDTGVSNSIIYGIYFGDSTDEYWLFLGDRVLQ